MDNSTAFRFHLRFTTWLRHGNGIRCAPRWMGNENKSVKIFGFIAAANALRKLMNNDRYLGKADINYTIWPWLFSLCCCFHLLACLFCARRNKNGKWIPFECTMKWQCRTRNYYYNFGVHMVRVTFGAPKSVAAFNQLAVDSKLNFNGRWADAAGCSVGLQSNQFQHQISPAHTHALNKISDGKLNCSSSAVCLANDQSIRLDFRLCWAISSGFSFHFTSVSQ